MIITFLHVYPSIIELVIAPIHDINLHYVCIHHKTTMRDISIGGLLWLLALFPCLFMRMPEGKKKNKTTNQNHKRKERKDNNGEKKQEIHPMISAMNHVILSATIPPSAVICEFYL